MKLYNFAASPNAIKVWAVIHHLDLQVESIETAPGSGVMQTADYKALNPNSTMPTLVDGDFVLWESNAIMQYLAHTSGDTSLWPTEPKAQASVSRWQCWQLAHWQQAIRHFMYENVVKQMFKMGPPDLVKLSEANELFHKHAAVLDAHLSDRQWVATDSVSLADFSLGSGLSYASMALIPLQTYTNINAWYARLSDLEGWKKSQPAMPKATATA